MKALILLLTATSLFSASLHGQAVTHHVPAKAGIDAGNQAWIDGMKAGDVARIIATYAEGAVDCGLSGDCFRGRNQIEQHMKAQFASLGRAHSASVESWGSSQHGDFVYEWGQAQAAFDGGKKVVDKYLTVWQRQADGSWKILRNLVIPEK
jgi:ketosteroid isomerase-like protein